VDWPSELLAQLPNRDKARAMEVVEASSLTPERFFGEYVEQLKPCLIRGAARHWPAFEKWRDAGYLKTALGNVLEERIMRWPKIEFPWRPRVWPRFESIYKEAAKNVFALPFDALIDRIARHEFIFSYARQISATSPLAPLVEDVGGFDFLPASATRLSPRIYKPVRTFFFGRSYTDWHVHGTDETLMCQIGAPKRVAMLGPGQKVFEAMIDVYAQESHNVFDTARFPKLAELAPQVFVVEPGDATYIPPFWWHAVESVGGSMSFGATVAVCWRTSDRVHYDPRLSYRTFGIAHHWTEQERSGYERRSKKRWLPAHREGRSLPAGLLE
jgi:hypothetical protein